jgi:anti-sigma B factor antagonist
MLKSVNVSAADFRYFKVLMSSFKLDLEKLPSSNESLTIYKATGKLSLETVNEFIQKMRAENAQYVVLDLGAVSFLDSAGVGSLVSLFVNRRNQGKVFALAALSPQSNAVVTVAGLQNLLPVYKTVEEAVAKKA